MRGRASFFGFFRADFIGFLPGKLAFVGFFFSRFAFGLFFFAFPFVVFLPFVSGEGFDGSRGSRRRSGGRMGEASRQE